MLWQQSSIFYTTDFFRAKKNTFMLFFNWNWKIFVVLSLHGAIYKFYFRNSEATTISPWLNTSIPRTSKDLSTKEKRFTCQIKLRSLPTSSPTCKYYILIKQSSVCSSWKIPLLAQENCKYFISHKFIFRLSGAMKTPSQDKVISYKFTSMY